METPMNETPLLVKVIFGAIVLIGAAFAGGHYIGERAAVEKAFDEGITAGTVGTVRVISAMKEGHLTNTMPNEVFFNYCRAAAQATVKRP